MLYKPLKYFCIFITITLIISFWGPVEYFNYNKFIVALYMLVFLLFFSMAYLIGISTGLRNKPRKTNIIKENRIIHILKFSILLSLFLAVWSLFDYINRYGFSIKGVGQAYVDIYANYERNSGRSYSLLELIEMFTGIFKQIAIVLGVVYYKKINNKYKSALFTLVVIELFVSLILTGKQELIGEISIYLISVFAIIFDFGKLTRIKYIKKYMFLLATAVLIGFVYIQSQRYNTIGISLSNYNQAVPSNMYMNSNHILFKILGEKWGFPFAILITSYLAGGYYGLSLCLQLPFKWTFGLAHSYSLAVIANRFFDLPFYFNDSYVMRMEAVYGWPAMSKWHTIFPYFASDFTFFGALIYFAVIAYIYAVCWVESIKFRNPISILMFSVLNIMLIFIPSNNQLMIGPTKYFSFITLTVIWLFFHKRFNYKNTK